MLSNYKVNNSLELLIKETEKALEKDCLFSALALLLIIPDVCGKALYGAKTKVGDRYKKWFDEYIGQYERCPDDIKNEMPYLNGDLFYKLRCAFLHEGSSEGVEDEYNDFTLNNFIIETESKKPFDIYSDETSSGDSGKEYIVNIRRLGVIVLSSAKATLKKLAEQNYKYEKIKVRDIDHDVYEMKKCKIENLKVSKLMRRIEDKTIKILVKSIIYEILNKSQTSVYITIFNEPISTLTCGDLIAFENEINHKNINVKVTAINLFLNFFDLYKKYNKENLGYNADDISSPYDAYKYYSKDEVNQYCAAAIEFKKINDLS